MPILPVRQNAQRIAQPTCVERQKVARGSRRLSSPTGLSGMKTDSISLPSPAAAGTSSCRRPIAPSHDLGRSDPEIPRQLLAELAADVAHGLEVDDAAAVDPLEDLAGVEARHGRSLRAPLEGGNVELGDVGAGIGLHGGSAVAGEDIQCTMP